MLGEGHDLSKDGLFIASGQPEPLGTLLEVEWEGRTGRTLRALARVAWVRIETRAGKPAGMGVEFVKTGPDGRPAVESVGPPGASSSMPPSAPVPASTGDLASDTVGADKTPGAAAAASGSATPGASAAAPHPDSAPPTDSALPTDGAVKADASAKSPSFASAKAALDELRHRISRTRRSSAPGPAAPESAAPPTAESVAKTSASPAEGAGAAEASDPAVPASPSTGREGDVADAMLSGTTSIGSAAAGSSRPPTEPRRASSVPPAAVPPADLTPASAAAPSTPASEASDTTPASKPPSSPPANAAIKPAADAEPSADAAPSTASGTPADAEPSADAAPSTASDTPAALAPESAMPAAAGLASDPEPPEPTHATSSAPPAPPPALGSKQVSSAPPPVGVDAPWSGSEWGNARADAAREDATREEAARAAQAEQEPSEPTEPGLADAMVARVLDAAQSVHDSFRPFELKGDVPTASFRWKPWVTRGLALIALAGVVTFSWLHGAHLLERILPPELMPLPAREPEATAVPTPAPTAPAPAAAPATLPPAAAAPTVAEGGEYALDVRTVPPRASAIIGGETIITPGVISLGAFPQPVELHIEKLGYQPEVVVIDRAGFVPAEGRMLRVLSLTLQTASAAPAPLDTAAPPAEVPPPSPAAPPPPVGKPALAANDSRAPAAPSQKPEAKKPAASKPTATKKDKGVAKTEAPAPTPGASPLQAAQACLARGDNACAVQALQGKARTAREFELLVETHRAMGNQVKAWEAMRGYLERFPDEKRADSYRRTLGQ